jgi:hypothetical protein
MNHPVSRCLWPHPGHREECHNLAAKQSTCSLLGSSVQDMKRRSLAFAAAANMSIVSSHPTDLDARKTLSHSVEAHLGPRRLLAALRDRSSWPFSMRASPLTCRKVGEIPALIQSDMSCSAADCMLGLFDPLPLVLPECAQGSAAVIDTDNDGARPWCALDETSDRDAPPQASRWG